MKKKNALLRLLIDNKKYCFGFVGIFFLAILAGPFKTAASNFWGEIVDHGIAGNSGRMLAYAGFMILMLLFDGLRAAGLYTLVGRTVERMFFDLRLKSFRKVLKSKLECFERTLRTGDTAVRLNRDIDELSDFISGDISNFLRLLSQGFFAVMACVFLSWRLSIAYMFILPVSICVVNRISKPIQQKKKQAMHRTGEAMSIASDVYTGIFTVKAFALEQVMKNRYAESVEKSYEKMKHIEKISISMTGIKYLSNVIQVMSIFILGIILMSLDLISVGNVISYLALSTYVNETFSMLDYMIKKVRNATAVAERVYEILDLDQEEVKATPEVKHKTLAELENVHFKYGMNEILKGVNIKIEQGKKVAIVGPSGSGKSTIIKLLCGFYKPTDGKVKMWDVDLDDWNREELRKNIALVTQESVLWNKSVAENLNDGGQCLSQHEVYDNLRKVGLLEFIDSQEEGIGYQVGEFGNRLSGGQRQRVCVARALVKKAPLLLLDEATSALDVESERDIQKVLEKDCESAQVIVAHRLTTVQKADYIYYLEDGKVQEEGTPEELIQKKGKYYQMCLNQGVFRGV